MTTTTSKTDKYDNDSIHSNLDDQILGHNNANDKT